MPADNVEFKAGGETYSLGPMSLWTLKRVWPFMMKLGEDMDPPDRAQVCCEFISTAMAQPYKDKAPTAEHLMQSLTLREFADLDRVVAQLLQISGFDTLNADTAGQVPSGEASGEQKTLNLSTGGGTVS